MGTDGEHVLKNIVIFCWCQKTMSMFIMQWGHSELQLPTEAIFKDMQSLGLFAMSVFDAFCRGF